jgi:hypothetical protein
MTRESVVEGEVNTGFENINEGINDEWQNGSVVLSQRKVGNESEFCPSGLLYRALKYGHLRARSIRTRPEM